jgi:phage-related protein
MARTLALGERPLDWVGSSKKDVLAFPEPVKDDMGNVYVLHAFQKKSPKGIRAIST